LLVTNTTLRPNEELLALLKQCKKITIQLSVDSYGLLNNFLRKGSNWDQVKENITWYRDTFAEYPVDVSIHSVASFYNVNLVHQLIDYCVANNLYHNYVVVDGPNWMGPRNLPEEIKPKILKYLETSINRYNEQHKKIFKLLKHEVSQPGDFGMFIRNDIRLNNIRNESWEHLNPWLWNEIQPYIVPEIL